MDDSTWSYSGRPVRRKPDGNPVTGEGYDPPEPAWRSRRARPDILLPALPPQPPQPPLLPDAPGSAPVHPDSSPPGTADQGDVGQGQRGAGEELGQGQAEVKDEPLRPEDRPAAGVASADAHQQLNQMWFTTKRSSRVPPGGFSSGLW